MRSVAATLDSGFVLQAHALPTTGQRGRGMLMDSWFSSSSRSKRYRLRPRATLDRKGKGPSVGEPHRSVVAQAQGDGGLDKSALHTFSCSKPAPPPPPRAVTPAPPPPPPLFPSCFVRPHLCATNCCGEWVFMSWANRGREIPTFAPNPYHKPLPPRPRPICLQSQLRTAPFEWA